MSINGLEGKVRMKTENMYGDAKLAHDLVRQVGESEARKRLNLSRNQLHRLLAGLPVAINSSNLARFYVRGY